MRLLVLLALETATVTPPPAPGQDCASGATEIVVCGRRVDPSHYRLPLKDVPAPAGPPRAEWGLGGGVRAGVTLDAKTLQRGVVSNRLMATVKIPF